MGDAIATTAVAHQVGTRSRAGNAMGRARTGVIDGALSSLVTRGTRGTSMSGIAVAGGVAKATVYNHFRTKDEVWAALIERELERAAIATADHGEPVDMLTAAMTFVAEHPARGPLAEGEPATLASLAGAVPGDARVRTLARASLARCGAAADPATVDLVLRVLASVMLTPGTAADREALVGALAASVVAEPRP